MQATYQTRMSCDDAALSASAALYGRVQRRLFAEVSSGRSAASRSAASMKRGYVGEYGIPARMFNAVRVSLEGKVSGARESQLLHAETLKGLVRRAGRELADARKRADRHGVHQKLRRLDNLRSRLAGVEADMAAGLVRLCFGGRKLWRGQYNLEANGYGSYAEWLAGWTAARDGEFFVLGSRDETGGCQLCVAGVAGDGSLTLRLRMPDCLAGQHGKYVVIEGLKFAYGHGQVLAALQANLEFAECRRRDGEGAARATSLGQAISYRFKRDEKGWRVFVTTDLAPVPAVTDRRLGAIGVDLNAGHLAVADTDASGNYLRAWRVPLATYGRYSHQAEALSGDVVAGVVEHARQAGKPIVIERLDFKRKKAQLEGESPKYARMLSSFSYGKIKAYFISRGHRNGVEVFQVNPAYSSVIGRVKFMERYGLSMHQAAALVLAIRLLGCSERIHRRWACPVGNGVHVAFTVPARKRVKHVWTHWGAVLGQLRPALAAQHRRGGPHPVRAVPEGCSSGVA